MTQLLESTELIVALEGGKRLTFPPISLQKGELVLMKGASGSGKSTWMHALAGLIPFHEGSVTIAGQGSLFAGNAAPKHWRRKALSFMPQRAFFWNSLTLNENLALAAWCKGLPQSGADLSGVGLEGKGGQSAHSLSLGEQQRVSALRAFLGSAPVLLADEPTASLDDANAEKLLQLFRAQLGDKALLVSSHDHRLAPFVDRIIDLP
ncbi:MAG: hypothetical protein RL168_117 [Bacteroidota bacterium]|jgi:putative ABC transport system ATP-binding protein